MEMVPGVWDGKWYKVFKKFLGILPDIRERVYKTDAPVPGLLWEAQRGQGSEYI